jgi:hypothetical protein
VNARFFVQCPCRSQVAHTYTLKMDTCQLCDPQLALTTILVQRTCWRPAPCFSLCLDRQTRKTPFPGDILLFTPRTTSTQPHATVVVGTTNSQAQVMIQECEESPAINVAMRSKGLVLTNEKAMNNSQTHFGFQEQLQEKCAEYSKRCPLLYTQLILRDL